MKKKINITDVIKKHPHDSAKLIEEFVNVVEDAEIGNENADYSLLFDVYKQDPTKDKWLFFGLTTYIIPLKEIEMLVIVNALDFHTPTIPKLREEGVNINDIIYFMHHMYEVFEMSSYCEDKFAYYKFSTMLIGGNCLAETIIYSTKKQLEYDLATAEDLKFYYTGLLEVMKSHDMEKIKLYIDYTLS